MIFQMTQKLNTTPKMKTTTITPQHMNRCRAAMVALMLPFAGLEAAPEDKTRPLLLTEVLQSVQTQYPPYLAAMIEQDIANGRARQALGAFDLNLNAGSALEPIRQKVEEAVKP